MWFALKLSADVDLRQHVQTLAIFASSRGLGVNGHRMDDRAELSARSMVARLPNLINVLVTTDAACSLIGMNEKTKLNIAQLHVYPTDSIDRNLLSQFSNVTHLVLSSDKLHSHCRQDGFDGVAPLCLLKLVSLKVYDHFASNTINILRTCK